MKTVYVFLGAVAFGAALHAQAPKPAAAPASKEVVLTATSANVKDSGTPVKIRIFRWSNDDERVPLVTALTAPPPGAGRAGGGRPGGAGRAAGGGAGRATTTPDAAAAPPAPAPDQAGGDAAPADAQAGRAARGGGAGGARGRGGRGGDAAPLTPIQVFTAALQKAPTVGYIWTTDVTGYSIKYAWHTTQPDGTERIVLATDRRLGAYSPAWTLNSTGTPTDYEFTLLELHLDPKGGEGKASLTTKLVADNDTKQLALENYAGTPAILQNVKRTAN
jgi:hypothetical protein